MEVIKNGKRTYIRLPMKVSYPYQVPDSSTSSKMNIIAALGQGTTLAIFSTTTTTSTTR